MNKGIKIEIASRILRDCKKNEIANICAVIFDFPGESLEDMQTTIDFLKERAGCIAAVSDQQFKLAEGSPIYKNYIKSKKTYWKESKKNKESRMVQCRLYLERIIGAVELACNARYNDLLLWHFYIASWEPLSEKKIMSYLHKKRFDKIFPLIPGRLKKIKNKVVFYPVNIRETDFINQILPPEEIILDRIEEKMVYFSDGYRSLKEILAELNGSFSEKYADRFILNKSVDFFKKTYKMNMVMNYARPLNT